MPFSQELKLEAHCRGFKCAEVPIEYRTRAGETKLNIYRDGSQVMFHLFRKRFSMFFSNAPKIEVSRVEEQRVVIEETVTSTTQGEEQRVVIERSVTSTTLKEEQMVVIKDPMVNVV